MVASPPSVAYKIGRPGVAGVYGSGMKYRDLIKRIEGDGWRQVRQRGSHAQYKHPTKPGLVTIPMKPGKDVPPGTLRSIMKQAALTD
jgi:predicted RNA binding protein YcfA (HicA-like mRNA interferase family)